MIAPEADDAARAVFAGKKNLRLLMTGGLPDPRGAGAGLSAGGGRLPGAGPRRRPAAAAATCRS